MNRIIALLAFLVVSLTLFAGARARPSTASSASLPVVQTAPSEGYRSVAEVGGRIHDIAQRGDALLVASGRSLVAVDISNPNRMHVVGEPLRFEEEVTAVAAYGDHVYAALGYLGVAIVAPTADGRWRQVARLDEVQAADLLVDGDRLYTAYGGEFAVYALTAPENPQKVAVFSASWSHLAVAGGYFFGLDGADFVIHVLDGNSPREVGRLTVGTVRAFDVAERFAYVATEANELKVLEIAGATAPQLRSTLRLPSHARALVALGDHVYLTIYAAIYSVDVADPAHPRFGGYSKGYYLYDLFRAGGYLLGVDRSRGYLHLFDIRTDAAFPIERSVLAQPATIADAAARGTHLYLALGSGDMQIVDTFDPAQPRLLGDYRSPPLAPTTAGVYVWSGYAQGIAVEGNYAYLANGSGGLHIVDVSRPEAPALRAVYYRWKPEALYPRDVAVRTGYAYVAHDGGMVVLDVANPAAPVEVASRGTTISGNLSQIVRLGDHIALSGRSGLDLYALSDPRQPALVDELRINLQTVSASYPFLYLGTSEGVQIWRLAEGGTLQQVGHYDGVDVESVLRHGDWLYLTGSWWDDELTVLDISEPSRPRLVTTTSGAPGALIRIDDEYVYQGGEALAVLARRAAISGMVDGGGTVAVPEAGITYHFPPEAFYSPTEIRHLADAPARFPLPAGMAPIGEAFEVQARTQGWPTVPNAAYTITVELPTGLAPASAASLTLFHLQNGEWTAAAAARTGGEQTATATTDRMGAFTLGAPVAQRALLPTVLQQTVVPAVDLAVSAIEVTQGMQRVDNSLPLVSGRPTTARVYARAGGATLDDVTLTLHGSRSGQPLPGSPLRLGPRAAFPTVERHTNRTSFDVRLPAGWVEGNVRLTAELVSHAPHHDQNRQNNRHSTSVSFSALPPLRVVVVPVHYTFTPTGVNCPAPAQVDLYSDTLLRMFPVDDVAVTFRTPIHFTGDLREESGELLQQVAAIKAADNTPEAVVYYGVFSIKSGDGQRCYAGPAGMGYLGRRASIGVQFAIGDNPLTRRDGSGGLAAHEIGHNFGLGHAPCPGTNPSHIDPDYPYLDGSIGEVGYDVLRRQVLSSGFPNYVRDRMTYCAFNGGWFSDYHYHKLFADQAANGYVAQQAPAPALLVRATVGDEESVLHPTYVLPLSARPARAAGAYQVELLDGAGRRLALHAVDVVQEAHGGGAAIFASLPLPEEALGEVRLLHEGQVVDSRRLSRPPAAEPALTPTLTPTTGGALLRWQPSDSPALVRYTVDDGASWTTLALDIAGGELALDRSQLPEGPARFEIRPADVDGPLAWELAVEASAP
ncbi:MAG: hypothetical protein R3272_09640 [Candidatus Promineifilaceae bacterium]|nr:hypothetical protein [Candidatus Promineifilaceae bacterium]